MWLNHKFEVINYLSFCFILRRIRGNKQNIKKESGWLKYFKNYYKEVDKVTYW